mmetsp:Transcript_9746/g.31925  ORF Transcript_9746/g.31925 Transcript_9746/m.31925 type:complete len:510 (-) Transcript_9746:1023-2552(-)
MNLLGVRDRLVQILPVLRSVRLLHRLNREQLRLARLGILENGSLHLESLGALRRWLRGGRPVLVRRGAVGERLELQERPEALDARLELILAAASLEVLDAFSAVHHLEALLLGFVQELLELVEIVSLDCEHDLRPNWLDLHQVGIRADSLDEERQEERALLARNLCARHDVIFPLCVNLLDFQNARLLGEGRRSHNFEIALNLPLARHGVRAVLDDVERKLAVEFILLVVRRFVAHAFGERKRELRLVRRAFRKGETELRVVAETIPFLDGTTRCMRCLKLADELLAVDILQNLDRLVHKLVRNLLRESLIHGNLQHHHIERLHVLAQVRKHLEALQQRNGLLEFLLVRGGELARFVEGALLHNVDRSLELRNLQLFNRGAEPIESAALFEHFSRSLERLLEHLELLVFHNFEPRLQAVTQLELRRFLEVVNHSQPPSAHARNLHKLFVDRRHVRSPFERSHESRCIVVLDTLHEQTMSLEETKRSMRIRYEERILGEPRCLLDRLCQL